MKFCYHAALKSYLKSPARLRPQGTDDNSPAIRYSEVRLAQKAYANLKAAYAQVGLRPFNVQERRRRSLHPPPLEAGILRRIHELAAKERMPIAMILDNETAGNGGIAVQIWGAESKNHTCDTAGKSGRAASDTGAHDAVLLSKM